jgi:hypothetical protein
VHELGKASIRFLAIAAAAALTGGALVLVAFALPAMPAGSVLSLLSMIVGTLLLFVAAPAFGVAGIWLLIHRR